MKWLEDLGDTRAEWLRQLPFSLSIPSLDFLVVHAGLIPGIPLKQQSLKTLTEVGLFDSCHNSVTGPHHTRHSHQSLYCSWNVLDELARSRNPAACTLLNTPDLPSLAVCWPIFSLLMHPLLQYLLHVLQLRVLPESLSTHSTDEQVTDCAPGELRAHCTF